ncbi:MAG: hypothetical protein R2788_10680 [Saprospiraceae bacterium]
MKRILLSLLFLAFFAAQMSAQIIEGKVVDKDGTPLIDAYVFKNNGMLRPTNELGIFIAKANQENTLNISYLGYKTKVLVLEQKHF